MSKTRASCFITGSKHRETDESTKPQTSCFHLFLGVWNHDEALALVSGKSQTLAYHSLLKVVADKAYLVDTQNHLSSSFHGQTY